MHDVIVVGAGPSGSKTAEFLGKRGLDVLLLEEHADIGRPVQCTGLNSHRIFRLSGASKKILMNKVKQARIYSPSGKYLELKSKKPVYVIDRGELDLEIAKRAKKYVKLKTSTRFENYTCRNGFLKIKTNKGFFQSKMLIGADGSDSTVAKLANIPLPDDLLIGYQETIKSEYDADTVELWYGDVAPDFFAWVVPENDEWARVGLACRKNASKYFSKFVEKRLGVKKKKKNVVGGLIRRGLIESSVADRVMLVGDAAVHVKPLSGGGIIYGLIGARYAAKATEKAISTGNYGCNFLMKEYDKKWKEKLGWPIRKGEFIDSILQNMPFWMFDLSVSVAEFLKPFLERLDMDLLVD